MLATAEVFQEPIGWLKFSACQNMPFMFVTAEVSQEPIVLVEVLGRAEHFLHVCHCRSVPGADRLVVTSWQT